MKIHRLKSTQDNKIIRFANIMRKTHSGQKCACIVMCDVLCISKTHNMYKLDEIGNRYKKKKKRKTNELKTKVQCCSRDAKRKYTILSDVLKTHQNIFQKVQENTNKHEQLWKSAIEKQFEKLRTETSKIYDDFRK